MRNLLSIKERFVACHIKLLEKLSLFTDFSHWALSAWMAVRERWEGSNGLDLCKPLALLMLALCIGNQDQKAYCWTMLCLI